MVGLVQQYFFPHILTNHLRKSCLCFWVPQHPVLAPLSLSERRLAIGCLVLQVRMQAVSLAIIQDPSETESKTER
jgi:hypothetical protein